MSDDRDPLAEAVEWAAQADAATVFEHRDFVRRALQQLADAKRWDEVIELARSTQGAMARGRRWGTWKEVLLHAEAAAEASGDRSSQAWAQHQLGTRALLIDDLPQAWPQLHSSLEVREQLGETKAAAVTRQNLKLLPLALAGVMTALTGLVGTIALLIPTIEREDRAPQPVDPVLDITDEVFDLADGVAFDLDNGNAGLRVELVNRGNVDLEGLVVDPASVVADGGDADCLELTLDEERCVLVLDISGVVDASQLVQICYSDCAQRGDTRLLIRP